jgi:hypothetical protein
MRQRLATILACLLMTLLGSCALLKPPADAYWLDPQGPRPSSDAVSLLHYSLYVRNLGGKQLAEETERVRLAHAGEKTDFRLLQYAMALSVPAASAADQRRALQLLDPLARGEDGRDKELRALASLMRAQLAEQRRLEEGSHSQQRRADDLEKKLEALKDIEKSLLPRGKTPGRPK